MGIRSSDREGKGEEPPSSLVVNMKGPARPIFTCAFTPGEHHASRCHRGLEGVLDAPGTDAILIRPDPVTVPDTEVEGRHGEGLRSEVPPSVHQHHQGRHTGCDADGLAGAEMGKGIGELRDHAEDLSTKTSTLLRVPMSRRRASRLSTRAE